MKIKNYSLILIINLLFNFRRIKRTSQRLRDKSSILQCFDMGRGDTGIADTDNAEAIFYNPAALAGGKKFFKQLMLASVTAQGSVGIQDFMTTLEGSDSPQILHHTRIL